MLASYILITFYSERIMKSQLLFPPNQTITLFLVVSFILSAFIVIPLYNADPPAMNKSLQYEFHEEFSLMNSFYVGVNSCFTNPFKIRHPYCYKCFAKSRWITAFQSSMLLTAFSSQKVAITVPSFLLFFQFSFIYLYFSRTILFKRSIYSILSLFVFYFAGGFGFIRWFWRDPRRDPKNDFVYIWSFNKHTFWSHPLFQYIFAYRPSQMSLSLIVNILLIIHRVFNTGSANEIRSKEKFEANELLTENLLVGILYGLTIPAQIEVTLSFSVYLIIFYIIKFFEKKCGIYQFCLIVFSVLLGFLITLFPQLFIILKRNNCSSSFLKFTKFSQELTNSGVFYADFVVWFESLGIFAIVTIALTWIYFGYTYLFSQNNLKDESLYAMKFYLPSFVCFLVINQVQFHREARQDIIAFYPCWMIISSMMFVYTFVFIVNSIKLNHTMKPNSKKNDDCFESNQDDIIEIKYNMNVHLRMRDNKKCEESHLEEIQGILIGWFSFFFVLAVTSSLIGFHRHRSKVNVYDLNDINLSKWIIKNTNIKALFYMDKALSRSYYSAVTALSGRIVIYDSSVLEKTDPNSFISFDASPAYRISQRMSRCDFYQCEQLSSDLDNLSKNLSSTKIIPKLKYVINMKYSTPKFVFNESTMNNWKLVFDNNYVLVYERI